MSFFEYEVTSITGAFLCRVQASGALDAITRAKMRGYSQAADAYRV